MIRKKLNWLSRKDPNFPQEIQHPHVGNPLWRRSDIGQDGCHPNVRTKTCSRIAKEVLYIPPGASVEAFPFFWCMANTSFSWGFFITVIEYLLCVLRWVGDIRDAKILKEVHNLVEEADTFVINSRRMGNSCVRAKSFLKILRSTEKRRSLRGHLLRGRLGWQLLMFSVTEVKMAKVPDLFEDLKHCYR